MILIIMAMMAMIQIDCSCGPGSTKGPFPDLVTLPISEEDTQGGYRRHHHYHHHHHHCHHLLLHHHDHLDVRDHTREPGACRLVLLSEASLLRMAR